MPFLTVVLVTMAATVFWTWAAAISPKRPYADGWYMRRFAYTHRAVTAPYCWRPLVPLIMRHIGVWPSIAATAATPLLIYGYLGGGWAAAAVALAFMGNKHIAIYNIRHPELSDSMGQMLLVATVWSLAIGHPLAIPLALLTVMCREAAGAMVLMLAVLTAQWWVVLAIIAGGLTAYWCRNEDKENRHPLVEATADDTVKRSVRVKAGVHSVIAWPQSIGAVRGFPLAIPWGWDGCGDFARLALAAYLPLWLLSLGASGASRHLCYGFILFAPFVAVLPIQWAWAFCLLSWFWPIDFSPLDENTDGKTNWVHARGAL